MTGRVHTGHDLLCLRPAACGKRFIDLFPVKLPVQYLIPQIPYSCSTVYIAKILIPITDAGVNDRHQDARTGQFPEQPAVRCITGGRISCQIREKESFRLLRILDLFRLSQYIHLRFRHCQDRVSRNQFLYSYTS